MVRKNILFLILALNSCYLIHSMEEESILKDPSDILKDPARIAQLTKLDKFVILRNLADKIDASTSETEYLEKLEEYNKIYTLFNMTIADFQPVIRSWQDVKLELESKIEKK